MKAGRTPVEEPQALFQRAVAEYEAGRFQRARKVLMPLQELPDPNGYVTLLAGLIDASLGDWKAAERRLSTAVERLPMRLEGWMGLGNARRMLGDAEGAASSFQQALRIQPHNADAWNNLAVANADMRRDCDALTAFDRALEIAPGLTSARRGRAEALVRLGRYQQARAAYEALLDVSPDDFGLALDYAELLEHANKPEEARRALPDAAELRTPKQVAVRELLHARLLRREGKSEEAVQVLQAARRKTRLDWLGYAEGELLDRLGREDEAMNAFQRANKARAGQWEFTRLRGQKLLEYLDHKIAAGIEKQGPQKGTPASEHERRPVFIVGLPRSGTTLLDRMLAAHPGIQVLEEPESLRIAEAAVAAGEGFAAARSRYWDYLENSIGLDSDRVIVDKNPMHALHLDQLPRLFPNACVILSLRHPFDAALSCYMQDFAPNPASMHFLELESTAKLCGRMLHMMQLYESACPERVYRLRYEDLVRGELKQQIAPLLEVLGLEWHADVERFAQKASQSGLIRSASYEQVTRGLYTSAVERWRRYEQWLQPFRDEFAPLLEYWGYEE